MSNSQRCVAIGASAGGIEALREVVAGRPIPEPDPHSPSPFLVPGQAHWFDTFGLDSVHDYDPVW